MSQYQTFNFENYSFDKDQKTLSLNYGYDDNLRLTETYKFDFDFVDYSPEVLDRACQQLFFMAGVSYYKAYLAPQIVVKAGQLDQTSADFYSKTYQRGLGEFFYVNKLDPRASVTFPVNSSDLPSVASNDEGQLIGIGGGKDSLVSVDILRDQPKVATWSVGHRAQLEPLVERIGLPHFWVERTWDRQLLELNEHGAYNGHVPISAILAHVGTVVAILSGYSDVVVANEASANEATLEYQGIQINHQYSKSLEFEKDYIEILGRYFSDSLDYYSLLRPLSELRIAELFSRLSFDKYKDVFSSCNRAFTHDSHAMFWCGECPKCAFIFLALTPFVDREKIENLFGAKNLLLDPFLEPTYRQLLGIEGDKPLECVGEIKENRAAMRLAQQVYPELNKYEFELPDDYDYKALGPHAMPAEVFTLLQAYLQ
jgi:UDP-N-acetyl-alpha-D-muramoyl-L-alanyl-L-glutamate epimerase